MEYSPKKMKERLEKQGFYFKKNFGQNFIVDGNIIDAIVRKSEIDQDTLVIEIGPGAGSLTYGLCQMAGHVLCYEIDHTLTDILTETLSDCHNYDVIYDDFLKRDVKADLQDYQYTKIYVVANLPYYITTPIIMKMIEDALPIDKIVVMVQKEVGDRFKATPGNREYGSLSVYLNYYYTVRKVLDISKHVFMPKPNVDSIVVELKRKEERLNVLDETFFFQLVRDSFKQKRKTLKNNLKGYPLDQIEKVLEGHKLDLSIRAEQIPLELFVELANSLKKDV